MPRSLPPARAAGVAAVAVALAACHASGEGTSVTINAGGGDTVGMLDGNSGEMKLDVPGFSGKLALPKIQLDAGNFDLNGVHLYPGSTIRTIDVAGAGGHDDAAGGVHVAFDSPAAPALVRDWFQTRLARAGYTLKPGGAGLVGTTDEDKPFRLDLVADGAGKTKGTIAIGG